jgi:hypothetical protein
MADTASAARGNRMGELGSVSFSVAANKATEVPSAKATAAGEAGNMLSVISR